MVCAGLSVVTAQWLELSAAAGCQLRCQQLSADALLGLQPGAGAAPAGAPAAKQEAGPSDSGDTSAAAPITTSTEPAASCTRAWPGCRRTGFQRGPLRSTECEGLLCQDQLNPELCEKLLHVPCSRRKLDSLCAL